MDYLKELLKEGGLRKVAIAVIITASSTYLLKIGVLPAEQYMQLMQALIYGFFGANVCEYIFKGKKK